MQVKLLHYTPNYHKLVETVARVCYQSYHKDDEKSHNFIKAIMSKGHISIASVGNMVFRVVEKDSNELTDISLDLLNMHEITQFVKWSVDSGHFESNKTYISMNMLTFLDLLKCKGDYYWASNLLDSIIAEVDKVPCLKWFYDKSVELPEAPNEYTAKGTPKLYEPIVLEEDYTVLKALGFTDYELSVHASITMNFVTDRSASLQFWRHWAGGCELSQRYVERGNAEFREIIIEPERIKQSIDTKGKSDIELEQAVNGIINILDLINKNTATNYESVLALCDELGIRKGRAKEIARSILPNAITTQLIQNRPYRNWQHLFKLRDSKHAQREIQEDVIHMKRVLKDAGVSF